MSYKVELKGSIVVQDNDLPAPGLRARQESDDINSAADEYLAMNLTVPAGAVDQTFSLTAFGLNASALLITTDQALTMKQGSSSFAQPIRTLFVATYNPSDGPATLKFSNAGSDAAHVKITLSSLN